MVASGTSGASVYFDVTGTMMVSVFYLLDPRHLAALVLVLPHCGVHDGLQGEVGVSQRRLTSMEWLVFRFGAGRAGRAARFRTRRSSPYDRPDAHYAGVGMGKFLDVFLPIDKSISTPLLLIHGLYIPFGGFSSVVYTDFFQTILMTAAALHRGRGVCPNRCRGLSQPSRRDWFSVMPVMHLAQPPKEYPDPFGLLVLLWVTKGIIGLFAVNGGVEFQRFRAARPKPKRVRWALRGES